MYDEYERALTGKTSRKGLSPFGWMLAAAGVFLLVAAAGVGYGMVRVTHRVRHMAQELSTSTAVATARAISHLRGSTSLVAMDPDAGLSFLQSLDSGDPSQALMQKVVGGSLDLSDVGRAVPGPRQGADDGSAAVHSDDGDVHISLHRGDNGGSLVLDSKDGHVRFDLVKNANGGSLTIHSDDGDARIDLVKEDGGTHLTVHSDDGTVDLSVGASSRRVPAWVPHPNGMAETSNPVFSLSTPDAVLGAAAWEDDASPADIVTAYRDVLEKSGYEVQAEHSRSGPNGDDASLWARRDADGRTVFVLARHLEGDTHAVLGYGEGGADGR